MANSFKKSLKHTIKNWTSGFSHLKEAGAELLIFLAYLTAPLTVFVFYPLATSYLWIRKRWRK